MLGSKSNPTTHPKDVPDLQFTSKTDEKGEILTSTEVSVMELNLASSKQETVKCSDWIEKYGEILPNTKNPRVKSKSAATKQKTVRCSDSIGKCGEISPKLEICVEKRNINSNEQHIAGYTDDLKKAATDRETEEAYKKCTWFQNPVNCVSKWSKVLKQGVVNSMGWNIITQQQPTQRGMTSLTFHSFCS